MKSYDFVVWVFSLFSPVNIGNFGSRGISGDQEEFLGGSFGGLK